MLRTFQMTLVFPLVCVCSSTVIKTAFLTKCCVGGGSIQKCVLTIQIDSSIFKLVVLL